MRDCERLEGEDGIVDGCIFWADEHGIRWCKDVHDFYGGGAGSLWYVSMVAPREGPGGGSADEVWLRYDANSVVPGFIGQEDDAFGPKCFTVASRGGGGYRRDDGERQSFDGADGALYWRDESGVLWCRDRYGVYAGGKEADYYSTDGGDVWYGDGEEWVEFSKDALEFMSNTTARKMREKMTSRSTYSRPSAFLAPPSSARGALPLSKLPPGVEQVAQGDAGDEKADEGRHEEDCKLWENERSVLRNAGRTGGGGGARATEDTKYAAMYGSGDGASHAARVEAEEARVNALFDRSLRCAPAPFWPELPLRL